MSRVGARAGRGQRGSATVLATVLCAGLCVAAVLVAAVGGVVADQRRLASAADLAALAGATAVQDGRAGCAAASSVARANRARLASCTVAGDVVTVRATRVSRPLLGRRIDLLVDARAGPQDAAP